MAQHSTEMFRCIRDGDVEGVMRLWRHERPHMPQPENTYQAAFMLHYARTRMPQMPDRLRFYSHRWLLDHALPSDLPDHLKPNAERMYPVMVPAVGVSSSGFGGRKTKFNLAVERVMSNAVLEAYADGHQNQPEIVKARMMEKRADFKRRS